MTVTVGGNNGFSGSSWVLDRSTGVFAPAIQGDDRAEHELGAGAAILVAIATLKPNATTVVHGVALAVQACVPDAGRLTFKCHTYIIMTCAPPSASKTTSFGKPRLRPRVPAGH